MHSIFKSADTCKKPRDLVRADALVERCLQLISQLEPRVWFLENPFSGLLRTREIMQGIPFVVLDYCMYQDPPLYRKRTAIWTNCTDWKPKLCDRTHLVNGRRHPATAQRGPRKGGGDRAFTLVQLHRLPSRLCDEVFAVCASRRVAALLYGCVNSA